MTHICEYCESEDCARSTDPYTLCGVTPREQQSHRWARAERAATRRRLESGAQDSIIGQADQDTLGIARVDRETVRDALQRSAVQLGDPAP